MVDNAPSVGIVRCSKNPVDARDKNVQQRAKSLSLAGALENKVKDSMRDASHATPLQRLYALDDILNNTSYLAEARVQMP